MYGVAVNIREVANTPYGVPANATQSDGIAQLGDEIATLSAHIHAATHRLLVLIADFDRLRGWELDGQRSCAHWLGDVSARTDDAPADVPISGTRAQRYQVLLHVELATLSADGEPGRAELEDGTGVSGETCRRLTCDASIVKVSHDRAGAVLDVARKTRTIPPALRRALEVRDRGCRFPGCGLRFTDAHHVHHWADGGETSLAGRRARPLWIHAGRRISTAAGNRRRSESVRSTHCSTSTAASACSRMHGPRAHGGSGSATS